MNRGKVDRDADAMMSEADATVAKVCKSLHNEHERRAKYFKEGKIHKYSLKNTVWVERHHKDVLTRHGQLLWSISGVDVRKMGQNQQSVQVGGNIILDRDRTQLRPHAPDPSGRAVMFEFTLGDLDSDDDAKEDDYTAERILTDKPNPTAPWARLYKVRWKRFAVSQDSCKPSSSFLQMYTTVWLNYLKKKEISLDVKDVLVHLIIHERD